VLQPDLVVCNNSLQQSLGSYSDGPDRPSWTATVRGDLNCKYDSPKPVLHFSLGRTTITLYRAFFVRTLLMLAHDESYLWVIVHFLRLSDVHECSCSIFLINNAALHLSWLWVIFMTSWEDLPKLGILIRLLSTFSVFWLVRISYWPTGSELISKIFDFFRNFRKMSRL